MVFDLDGTLVDSERDIMLGVLTALADQGIDHLTLEDLKAYLGYPLSELYATLVAGGDDRGHQRFVHIFRAYYCDHCTDHTSPYPSVPETLERLAGVCGLELAVATAKPTWSAVQILQHLGLAHYFRFILGSERHRPKPDPGVLLTCSERLSIPPEQIAMVGDTDRDVLAAKAAGMRSIAVAWGGWPREKLLALNPDALVDRPEQIPDEL